MADDSSQSLCVLRNIEGFAEFVGKTNKAELQKELDKLGLNRNGKKEDLAGRLKTAIIELLEEKARANDDQGPADKVGRDENNKDRLIIEKDKRIKNLEEINELLRYKVDKMAKEVKLLYDKPHTADDVLKSSPARKQQMAVKSNVNKMVEQFEGATPIKLQRPFNEASSSNTPQKDHRDREPIAPEKEGNKLTKEGMKNARDNKYRNLLQRRNTQEVAECLTHQAAKYAPGTAMLVGDSLIRGAVDVCVREGCDVSVYPGIRVNDLKKQLISKQEIESEPKVVIVHAGTNNLKSRSKVHLVAEFDDLIETVSRKWTNVKWVIGGLIYRRGVFDSTIDKLNDGLKWLCEERKAVFYDPNSRLSIHEAAKDGLHLNRRGGIFLAQLIVEKIDETIEAEEENHGDVAEQ